MGDSEKFGHREEGVESESSREYQAFRGMVAAAGGLEKVASSVLEHVGVAKIWVYDWYNHGRTPSVNVTRQIFSELRHLVREAQAKPEGKEAEPAHPAKAETVPLKPQAKKVRQKPAKPQQPKQAGPKLTYRERQKQATEARLMKDEEYRKLHKSLVEKGLISPSSNEKE